MFGHFNDAISSIDVGIEGKGAWRSKKSACEPGVQYSRRDMICICNGGGNWPNPVCRDVFRILHPVELLRNNQTESCTPGKLSVVGCNVCPCSKEGRIEFEQCTKRNCSKDDPILKTNNATLKEVEDDKLGIEVYAECQLEHKYEIGCSKCMCLRNNRLVCEKCTNNTLEKVARKSEITLCTGRKPGLEYESDCNKCFCVDEEKLYCTTKVCYRDDEARNLRMRLSVSSIPDGANSVEKPFNELSCTPGTTYPLGCNSCHCFLAANGKKMLSCTLKQCGKTNALESIKTDCVPNTVYLQNCLLCRCDVIDGIKIESCELSPKCPNNKGTYTKRNNLNSLGGHCEPLHVYNKECNTCQCMRDGKVVECSTALCDGETKKAITVDIVPITQKNGGPCPKDRMYKVDCNVCFCLTNGNALCTTVNCKKKQLN